MITVSIFITLLVLGAIAIIYAFIDNNNQYYGNIIALLGATGIFGWLGIAIQNGNVGITETIVENSSILDNITSYNYASNTIPVIDPSLGILLIGVGSAAFIIMALLIIEAVITYREDKKEAE